MKSFREQQQDAQAKGQPEQPIGEDLAERMSALSHMDEGQLTALLMSEASKARAEGNLDGHTLQAFYDRVAPMLTPEQKEKMAQLIALIAGH